MLVQTIRPSAWLIVDNGSTDGTTILRSGWQARTTDSGRDRQPADRAAPGAPIVRAFNAGLQELEELPDVVVKLDADVSMEKTTSSESWKRLPIRSSELPEDIPRAP